MGCGHGALVSYYPLTTICSIVPNRTYFSRTLWLNLCSFCIYLFLKREYIINGMTWKRNRGDTEALLVLFRLFR